MESRDHRGGGRSSARGTSFKGSRRCIGQISITPIGYSHHGIYFTGRSYKTGRQLHGLRSGLDRNQPGALSRSGESKRNARPDLQNQRRRRYHWRCTDCVIKGCPIGLGQPVYGKLHAALGNAMLSINAAKAFEYGDGFKGLKRRDWNKMTYSTTIMAGLKHVPTTPEVYREESATDRTSFSG